MKTLNPIPTSHFAAYIGLDWSDGKHDLCLQDADTGVREPAQIEHSPEAIDARHRTQRQLLLGPLALELSHLPTTNLRRVGGAHHPALVLANAFYRQQSSAGKTHQAALRALAYKWIRILHRCWMTRQPYDESIYLNAEEAQLTTAQVHR